MTDNKERMAFEKWMKERKVAIEFPTSGDAATGFQAGWQAAFATRQGEEVGLEKKIFNYLEKESLGHNEVDAEVISKMCGYCRGDGHEGQESCNRCDGSGEIIIKGKWEDDEENAPFAKDIHAAHPTVTGNHATYSEAMSLVEFRRSKYALIDLVNWLLVKNNELQNLWNTRASSPTNQGEE